MLAFLVHTVVEIPAELSSSELEDLRRAEAERAGILQSEGVLRELWRESGRLAAFGIWCADDESAVRAAIATLPLSKFMTITVSRIEAHPNAAQEFAYAG